MSGYAGIYHRDGAPVDARLLGRMTDFLVFRGPDGCATWADGPIGLGHALLRTAEDFPEQQQPLALDGQVWIVADARIDARDELLAKLNARRTTPIALALDDARLILASYQQWGERCVEHLLGDFSFVIWDAPRKLLFGARDHLGVKPFYYADKGKHFLFSNTLSCLRLHPEVSSALDDRAIAGFLLFDVNHEMGATSYADIRRLPPAHFLLCDAAGLRVERYWTLQPGDTVRYQRKQDYVDRFRDLLQKAVSDRLRTRTVSVSMTGGLDSSSIAATALDLLKSGGAPFSLRAYTEVFDHLFPDEERHYSGLVAKQLGIPIHYFTGDDYALFERWQQAAWRAPEPEIKSAGAALFADEFAVMAKHSRVLLDGNGGDPLFVASIRRSLLATLRKKQYRPFIAEALRASLGEPRSFLNGLWARLKNKVDRRTDWVPYPEWLEPGLAARLDLHRLWEQRSAQTPPGDHPRAWLQSSLTGYSWPQLFEGYDPGTTHEPIAVRYPYFDLRMIDYMMGVPPVPWSLRKLLIREAMRGVLPEPVRRRPKAVMAADPLRKYLEAGRLDPVRSVPRHPALAHYVRSDWELLPTPAGAWREAYRVNLRAVVLNLWLHSQGPFDIKEQLVGR
ncbi:MAG: asparagine synthetase B [Candidatus Koribacter versatilis]|uniref:asparagine synthase (glutamine-hydrolyzing) n=1 Tax=Candidatus Korobacter versatilis TaxID=658062 RepID=A0A932A7P0_9BACT|nr:asparagine synthetase B [Candidatus Koribacter versatilis]